MIRIVALISVLAGAQAVIAAPITYTISGVANNWAFVSQSGIVGPSQPADQFTIRLDTDTDLLMPFGPPPDGTIRGSASATIGSNTPPILFTSGIFQNGSLLTFFQQNNESNAVIGVFGPGLNGYDLSQSIAPQGLGAVLDPNRRLAGEWIATSDFVFTMFDVSSVTFEATQPMATAVEPASMAFVGIGLLAGIASVMRKRRHGRR